MMCAVSTSEYPPTPALYSSCPEKTSPYLIIGIGLLAGVVTHVIGWLTQLCSVCGPIITLMILSLAGITQYGMERVALLPVAIYFDINLLEAQFITPTVLGRHMRLNPLILILWLLVWGWLWGPAGLLLAVPLLVCLKLAPGQLNIMTGFGGGAKYERS
jgi:predicted PurR-regulated permease PerM